MSVDGAVHQLVDPMRVPWLQHSPANQLAPCVKWVPSSGSGCVEESLNLHGLVDASEACLHQVIHYWQLVHALCLCHNSHLYDSCLSLSLDIYIYIHARQNLWWVGFMNDVIYKGRHRHTVELRTLRRLSCDVRLSVW